MQSAGRGTSNAKSRFTSTAPSRRTACWYPGAFAAGTSTCPPARAQHSFRGGPVGCFRGGPVGCLRGGPVGCSARAGEHLTPPVPAASAAADGRTRVQRHRWYGRGMRRRKGREGRAWKAWGTPACACRADAWPSGPPHPRRRSARRATRRAPRAPSAPRARCRGAHLVRREGRGVSNQYGGRDAACPLSTREGGSERPQLRHRLRAVVSRGAEQWRQGGGRGARLKSIIDLKSIIGARRRARGERQN
jgi:hypothetical protein